VQWRRALDRLKAIDESADHRCFHTSDVLPPDALKRAHEIACSAPPLSSEQVEALRPLFRQSPEQVAERDRLLPLEEAAEALGHDRPTVSALIQAGELIAEWGPGNTWVVPNWAVRAYRSATNTTFCIDCHGFVDGKLTSRWLTPRRRRHAG